MPPFWKIKREVKTLRDQLSALVELCLAPLRQRLSDPKIHELTRVQSGDKPLGSKVALFLIYQPNGLSSSVITTCSHLALKGYSVLLISNSALENHDLQALAPYVWRFVQRINYGYDFGGYRDGIRLLWAWSVTPDSLLILNDSIWYPLNASSEMIELMENSPAEFLGAIKHVDGGKPDTEHGGFFLSYFFMVKKTLFLSPIFSDFWKSYVATSNKYLTVRRGERGFSKAMFSAGVKSEGVYSKDRFMRALKKATPEDVSRTLKYGAYTDAEFIQQRDRLVEGFESTEAWKLDAISHIESVASKRNFHSSFCYGTIKILGIPFLKKNKGELQIRTRQQYLLAVKAGDLPSPYSLAQSEKLGGEVSDLEWIEASQKMLSEISA